MYYLNLLTFFHIKLNEKEKSDFLGFERPAEADYAKLKIYEKILNNTDSKTTLTTKESGISTSKIRIISEEIVSFPLNKIITNTKKRKLSYDNNESKVIL